MDLRTAAAELYRALPGDFMATRTSLVKEARADGDRDLARAIGALPKPTVAAWAVNLLVRTHHAEVEQLLDVGAQLREAQAALSGQDLRELNKQQHRLLGAVRRQAEAAARQAGQRLSDPIAQRVQATLHAGMADPWAANALRSGALVRDLESTGLGPVDLEGAVAVPDAASAERAAPADDEVRGTQGTGGGAKSPRTSATSRTRERTTPTPTPTRATRGKDEGHGAPAERGTPHDAEARGERRTRDEAEARAERARQREARERAEQERREREEREAREREEREARERAAREAAARAREDAERKAAAAEAAAQEARAALDEAEAKLDEVADERADLATRIAELTQELRTLRDQDREADVREREARSTRSAAARAATSAERAVDRARTVLDHLDG